MLNSAALGSPYSLQMREWLTTFGPLIPKADKAAAEFS